MRGNSSTTNGNDYDHKDSMMKTNHKISATAAIILCLSVICACEKNEGSTIQSSSLISFNIYNDGDETTKAAYSGTISDNKELINWEVGDLIRIYCSDGWWGEEQNLYKTENVPPYGDYVIKSVNATNPTIATITLKDTSTTGLRWNKDSSKEHHFYSAYPSPESSGITTSIEKGKVEANLPKDQYTNICTISITSTENSNDTQFLKADLKWMLMTAYSGPYTQASFPDAKDILLTFRPMTTAIEFTIKNGFNGQGDMIVSSVELISESMQISGSFTVPDFKNNVTDGYPTVTPKLSPDVNDRTVRLNFPNPITVKYGKYLKFTFFLTPTSEISGLSFKITMSDSSTLKTRLGYTDGTYVTFPRCKKSFVRGLLVPEGAQWTINYEPVLTDWSDGGGENITLD